MADGCASKSIKFSIPWRFPTKKDLFLYVLVENYVRFWSQEGSNITLSKSTCCCWWVQKIIKVSTTLKAGDQPTLFLHTWGAYVCVSVSLFQMFFLNNGYRYVWIKKFFRCWVVFWFGMIKFYLSILYNHHVLILTLCLFACQILKLGFSPKFCRFSFFSAISSCCWGPILQESGGGGVHEPKGAATKVEGCFLRKTVI